MSSLRICYYVFWSAACLNFDTAFKSNSKETETIHKTPAWAARQAGELPCTGSQQNFSSENFKEFSSIAQKTRRNDDLIPFLKSFILFSVAAVLLGLGIHKYQDQIQELSRQVTQLIKDSFGVLGLHLGEAKDKISVSLRI